VNDNDSDMVRVVRGLSNLLVAEAMGRGKQTQRADNAQYELDELRERIKESDDANDYMWHEVNELRSMRSHAIELLDACSKSKHTTPRMAAAIDSLKKALGRTEETPF
jgi:hypothetical protein